MPQEPIPADSETASAAPEAKTAQPDHGAEMATLREELAKTRGEFQATIAAKDKEMAEVKGILYQQNLSARAPKSPATKEEWETLFQNEGIASTFGKFTEVVLDPYLRNVVGGLNAQHQKTLDRFAKSQREMIRSDPRVDDTVMAKVDTIMDKLSVDEKAEPGAWREAMESVVEQEEFASWRMNGGQMTPKVMGRRQGPPEEEGGKEPKLTEEELKWAQRFGMKPSEYKKAQDEIMPLEF